VSSGEFDAAYVKKYVNPKTFLHTLWNAAGPSAGAMVTCLNIIKNKLEGELVGVPAEFRNLPEELINFMYKEVDFWGFLCSWGGEWMWEGVEPGKDLPRDILQVADGLTNGSLIWVTDGSYDRKKVIDLCGVGWIISCTKTGYRITGTFWEKSNSASSYRAELLGLCAMHFLAWVVAEYHHINR
jgi:hypothetical protein